VQNSKPRLGRARRYDIYPVIGMTDSNVAYAVAMLDELSERLYDLISDLTQEALDYVPQGMTNSIAMLVVHIAWAEGSWISRATGYAIPPDLEACLLPGRQDASGELPVSSSPVDILVAYCRAVRQNVTMPALASVDDIGRELETTGELRTVRQVLMHVIWHWTYHSGQVGLLRRLWGGQRYRWTFGSRGSDRPAPSC
jgi:uncharacterized damage-inducible protein DinB